MRQYVTLNLIGKRSPEVASEILRRIDLSNVRRSELLDLWKWIDETHIEGRCASCFNWYEPWLILARYLDPMNLVRWPDPDWSQIEGGE